MLGGMLGGSSEAVSTQPSPSPPLPFYPAISLWSAGVMSFCDFARGQVNYNSKDEE